MLTYIYPHKISKMHLNIQEDWSEGENIVKNVWTFFG